MRPALAVLGVALAFLVYRSARAAPIDPDTGLPDIEPAAVAEDDGEQWAQGDPYAVDAAIPGDDVTNLQAFGYAVRRSEHNAADVASGADYFTFYGGGRFTGTEDHPAVTREMRGVPLPEEWCRRLGYADGQCVSTAAGAYQFTRPTWLDVRDRGERLDFTPAGQDEGFRRLLERDGVLPLVEAGSWHDAVARASSRWASLPGSKAGQHVRSWEFVAQAITDGLNAQA